MFENPRRGRQARNFTTNSRSQIVFRTDIFRKLTLGAPALCVRLKNSEKIALVLKAESKAVVEIASPRSKNELQRTYSLGLFVRAVCFVTKP